MTTAPSLNGKISLPVQAAADAIGVSRSSLYERIKCGDLPSFKSCGRRLIRVAALLEMLDRDEATTTYRPAANISNCASTAGSADKNALNSASWSAAGSA